MSSYNEQWREQYRVGAASYLRWVLRVRADVESGKVVMLRGLFGEGGPGLAGWQAWFRYHMQGRINRKVPDPRAKWRKMDADYHRAALQDQIDAARAHQRVRVYQFRTRAARERLGHLLSSHDD